MKLFFWRKFSQKEKGGGLVDAASVSNISPVVQEEQAAVADAVADSAPVEVQGEKEKTLDKKNVSDRRRRLFLKSLGVMGLGIFGITLFPKKTEALILGGTPTSSVVGVKDSSNVRIDPAKDSTLLTIDTDIQAAQPRKIQDSSGNALTSTASALDINIKSGAPSVRLQDGTGNAIASAVADPVGTERGIIVRPINSASGATYTYLKDAANTVINPATEDAITYLRRMVKQMDSLAVVDSAQRQKVTIDAGTLPIVTTVTTVSTVTSVTSIAGLSGVDARYLYIDTARNAYANGIRNNLVWS